MTAHVARRERTRRAIVASCGQWMRNGRLRPTAEDIARGAGCAVRTVFQYFPRIDGLYVAALDLDVSIEIHNRLELLSPTEMVKALVLGRLPE